MTASRFALPSTDAAFTDQAADAIPIYPVRGVSGLAALAGLTPAQYAWSEANGFTGKPKSHIALPGEDGRVAVILAGLGEGTSEPCGPSDMLLGQLAQDLPTADYRLAGDWRSPQLACLAWGLGAYRFRRYKATSKAEGARLVLPETIDAAAVRRTTAAVWLGRDLINTPANDMGPDRLEAAARAVASRHQAACEVITGAELLDQNFPLIHAVGRAAAEDRAPRLIDIRWGSGEGPRITIVGKGVCFDTGGLDLKPPAGMLLMKKDMGGAAAALALADMIMGAGLAVRLRVLIPAVENSVAGNAFRPGDVIPSRAGATVEIGNTDAEGRLVLADALSLGDEEAPDLMMTFATLTGAARVALGPDLPPVFVDDDTLAQSIIDAGAAIGDPVWRMPFWPGYDGMLDSPIADMSNTGESPFAGSVTAALFLRRFVRQARHYAHFDIFGWRPSARALGPKGGEPHVARTMFDVVSCMAAASRS